MLTMNIVVMLALIAFVQRASAYASRFSCTAASGSWIKGGSCGACISGPMGQSTNTFGTGLSCSVAIDSSAATSLEYNPGQNYVLTITSSSAGHKINSNLGALAAQSGSSTISFSSTCRGTSDGATVTTSSYSWTAPFGASGPAVISAICGNQGSGIHAADQLTLQRNASADTSATASPAACTGANCGSASVTTLGIAMFMCTMLAGASLYH